MDESISSDNTSALNNKNFDGLDVKPKYFPCEFCAEKFLKEIDLQMHFKLHRGSSSFCCSLCKESFSCLNELKMHDLHHSIKEANEGLPLMHDLNLFEEMYVCHICDKAFLNEAELMNHSMLHLIPESNSDNSKRLYKGGNAHILFEINKCFAKYDESNILYNERYSREVELDVPSVGVKSEDAAFKSIGEHSKSYEIGQTNLCPDNQKSESHFPTERANFPASTNSKNVIRIRSKSAVKIEKVETDTQPKRKLWCDICNIDFTRPFNLKRHYAYMHNVKEIHTCHVCNMTFKEKIGLINHVCTRADIREFTCSICALQFRELYQLKSHYLSHESSRPFVCDLCGSAYKRKHHLKRHFSVSHCKAKPGSSSHAKASKYSPVIHHFFQGAGDNHVSENKKSPMNRPPVPKKVSCYVCKKAFTETSLFQEHFKLSHKDLNMNQCHLCFKQCKSAFLMRSHLLLHINEKKFKCNVCTLKFGTVFALREHRNSHLSSKSYKCTVCSKIYTQLSSFKTHILQHEKAKHAILWCDECLEKFVTRKSLNRHISQFHNPAKKFVCEVCKQMFSRQYHLKRHRIKAHGKKESTVSEDTKTVIIKSEPDIQISNHINLPQQVNSITIKSDPDDLPSNHVYTKTVSVKQRSKPSKNHTLASNERDTKASSIRISQTSSSIPKNVDIIVDNVTGSKIVKGVYRCKICGRSFSQKAFLVKHKMSVHSEKTSKNECALCGKSFPEKFNLETHLLLHEEEKQLYSCTHCECSFSRKSLLIRHTEIKHKLQ